MKKAKNITIISADQVSYAHERANSSSLISTHAPGRESYKPFGTTANKGTRGSLVRMTPDVVYYSWAAFDTNI